MNKNETFLITFNRATYFQLSFLGVLWLCVFIPIYPELVSTWLNHSNNSHGLLVPFITLYFIWQKKDELQTAPLSSSNSGLVLLVGSLLMYFLSLAGHMAFMARIMFIFSLVGLVTYNLGWDFFKKISFPLLFLLFMVPIPLSLISKLTFPLQLFASDISASIISSFSIPVYQEGNMLFFAKTQLEVAEACSGIRSLVSLTMLSILFFYMSSTGWLSKTILLISATPIALLANIMRVTGTGVLAHYYGEQVAQGFLHDFSGLAVFAFGFLVLLGEFTLLNKSSAPRHSKNEDRNSLYNLKH